MIHYTVVKEGKEITIPDHVTDWTGLLEAAYEQGVEAEREECAKLVIQKAFDLETISRTDAAELAKGIRARGDAEWMK